MPDSGVIDKLRRLISNTVFQAAVVTGKRMVASSRPTIIFAPHQDDETYGCGGLIAQKVRLGGRLKVVFLTDGGGTCGKVVPAARDVTVATRRAEAMAASAVLGLAPDQLEFLSHADGTLALLQDERRLEAVEQISAICRGFQPEEIYLPHRRDKHADHEAAHDLVVEAIRLAGISPELFEYAIWLIWWANRGPLPSWHDFAGARVLSIADVLDRKRRAMAAFATQQEALPPGFVDRFHWPHELFFQRTEADQS